jgi:hypothetical protein
LPSITSFSKEFQSKTKALQDSATGKYAFEMYENERRLKSFRKISSKEPQYNPGWANPAVLSVLVTNMMFQVLIPVMVPNFVNFDWGVTIVYWVALVAIAYMSGYFSYSTVLYEKCKKIYPLLKGCD